MKRTDRKRFLPLSKAQVGWFTALFLIGFIWFVYPGYGWNFNIFHFASGSESEVYAVNDSYDETYALDNISLVGNWTKEAYESLEVATVNYDIDYVVEDYEGGDTYSDLVEEVGRPQSTYRNELEDFDTVDATWEYSEDNSYISVDITYLAEDGRIISKAIYGYDD